MNDRPRTCSWLLALLITAGAVGAHAGDLMVQAKATPQAHWTSYPTRTLASLPLGATSQVDSNLSQYGGWLGHQGKATGFFYPTNLDGRWWLVDPEGCLYLDRGMVTVSEVSGAGARTALLDKFGSESNWVERTIDLLRSHGFSSLGAWSDAARFRRASHPMVYTRLWDFMSTYGRRRGGTYQQSGHIGYPNDCIFVFDPEFETFCDSYARQLAKDKDDPWLLGHFSDNEMPFKRDAIRDYLHLPATDPGHLAALAWLKKRHGPGATEAAITDQDRQDFLALVTERYFSVVSKALKKYDPNHLFLGSRFHGGELNYPEVFKAAGRYLDVVAVNYYRTWTPAPEKLQMWARASGRPILITEWYVKAEDSGLPNNSGAGWIVKTQQDRGWFYQNFTLELLESKVCVGWQWFKYADNDPSAPNPEPSNRDSNKGIVTARYEPYPELLAAMNQLNERVYSLADYFDHRPHQASK